MTTKSKLASEVEDTAKTVEAVVEKKVEHAMDAGKAVADTVAQRVEDVAAAGTEKVEAMIHGTAAAVKYFEAINTETMIYAKQSVEDGVAAAKALIEVRSIQELVDIQGRYSRTAVDRFVDYSTKLNDMVLGATREMFRPLGGDLFDLRMGA